MELKTLPFKVVNKDGRPAIEVVIKARFGCAPNLILAGRKEAIYARRNFGHDSRQDEEDC
jgi:hypothetical protein